MSQSLSITHTHTDRSQRQLILTGDALREKMERVIHGRFQHRNEDGTLFTPRVSGSFLWPGVAFVVTIDSERLWHFSVARMCNQDTTDLMSIEVGRPVRVIRKIPAGALGNATIRETLAYAVLLNDTLLTGAGVAPAIAAPKFPLPRIVDVDFGNIPSGELMVPIGKTAEHTDLWVPLAKFLHCMVIGESGSGKSNWLKVALVALLKQATPDQLRIAVISPKRAEFAAWSDCPHTWRSSQWGGGIAANADDADRMLMALRAEFDSRDIEFARVGVTNLADYCRVTDKVMPRLLILADEMLDLALLAKNPRQLLGHLAAQVSIGRSHGFHLFLGTTNPRFDVLPTLITRNVENRLCARVVDARSAQMVNCPGAETIPEDAKGRFVARVGGVLYQVQAFCIRNDSAETGGVQLPESGPRLSADERRLVSWALAHPDEFEGGLQQNLLEVAFDVASPRDGGGRLTARQIRAARARLTGLGLINQRPGCGTKYFTSERVAKMVSST